MAALKFGFDGCCLLAGDDDDKFARGAGLSELT